MDQVKNVPAVMSRSVMKPLSAGASLPASVSLLHRRLLVAEGQGAELAKKMGVSGDELVAVVTDGSQPEALVARVFRLESLLHALRLRVFRMETARELASSQTAHLQEQLAALQEQSDEEQRSSRREVKRLRDQLQQEREDAQTEAHTLRERLHVSYRSQTDMAVAADELKKVKVQLSRKLYQMKEALAQETAARLEAEQSHDALRQRVKETEGEVEKANEQVKLLQTDCHALNVDGQQVRAELVEKAKLVESVQDSTGSWDMKSSSMRITLQKEQQHNSTLLQCTEELTPAKDKVQALNNRLEAQRSDLSSALRSLTEEKVQLQASLKIEQERSAVLLNDMNLQLDTVRKNMLSELQETLADKRLLNKELEALRADRTKLKQSSVSALDAAVKHQELLERTITRLRGELSNVNNDGDTLQKEKEGVCAELECVRANYKNLQEQLKQVQEELDVKECQMCVLRSEVEYVKRENLSLKDQLQNTHMKNTEMLQIELGEKLDELRRLGRQREAELHRAKQEINQLTKQVDDLRRAKHHGRRSAQQEVCELKKALGDLSFRSCDLSRTNQQLREKMLKLENLVSDELRQRNKTELNKSARTELLDLSSSQQEELQAERRLTHTLQQKCQMLEECVVKLNEERDEAEQKMKEVRFESQQISENLQEAHSWFRAKFNSLKYGSELQEETGYANKTAQDGSRHGEVVCVAKPELEPWASTLHCWEMKKELDHMANS